MSDTGLGRVVVNAGRSRSIGMELALRGRLTEFLSAHATYGYTHATFRDYTDVINGKEVSLRGNFVPFVPQHTLNVGARYLWKLNGKLKNIKFSADYNSLGKMYWDEANVLSQGFYGTLNARVEFALHNDINISVWGQNLTARQYQAFAFMSMGRTFEQQGRPLQIGATLNVKL